ncbi:phage integrase N-terminal SAM-like domain-containing protein [Halomonas huangheensis]|uniref:phage integrase N-terminal SAM-like domain-containing protein n=1 Tax=Halomonas huangheensis TaxID=1178482 RepID=UPI0009DBF625
MLTRFAQGMRVKRYSPCTDKTYCYWIRFFIRFHGVRHPASTRLCSGGEAATKNPSLCLAWL